jgi:chaperonin cofactor prefoldin
MATTTKELSEKVTNLSLRLSTLKDEIVIIRTELERFRTDVASDVKTLSSALNERKG